MLFVVTRCERGDRLASDRNGFATSPSLARGPGVVELQLASVATRHCWKCGLEYKNRSSPGRSETCDCGADLIGLSQLRELRSNCRLLSVAIDADPVEGKHLANYCEWFVSKRVPVAPVEETAREKGTTSQPGIERSD